MESQQVGTVSYSDCMCGCLCLLRCLCVCFDPVTISLNHSVEYGNVFDVSISLSAGGNSDGAGSGSDNRSAAGHPPWRDGDPSSWPAAHAGRLA